ncbi:MAG: HAMP domain-containing histidine kinase [Caldimicrobium sp.]|nr:HAMP domain-containing histidine kinase [Caldimicrobium sp.]
MTKALKRLLERIKQRLSTQEIVPPEAVDLRIFFEAPIPIFLCDEKGKVLEQNRKAYYVFGYGKDKFITTLLPGIKLKLHHHGFSSRADKHRLGYFEYYVEGKNPLIVYVIDKTDLQTLKEEYRFAISYLSHELKTPIAVAQTKAEALLEEVKKGASQEKVAEGLTEIVERIINLSNLVKRLFQMSSVLVKELKVERRKVKASELLADLKTLTEELAEEKDIKLIFDLTEDFIVNVDPELFLQALFNLVENAIKFTPEGKKVWVSARKIEDRIYFRVEDEGPGVPEEELPFLTRPFYRARYLGKGLGLGLFLVETIAKAHGGRLKLANASPPKTGFIAKIELDDLEGQPT